MKKELISKSKFLSLVLRHKPEEIGLNLDTNGWASVEELLSKTKLSKEELDEIVTTNEKKRFAFNEDQTKIRASQGHSIQVDLDLKPFVPPQILFHGTAISNKDVIAKDGISKMQRQYVHLSPDIKTATQVGMRHGKPVIFVICAMRMHKDGYKFYQSENGVWLTDSVPGKYLLKGVIEP